MKLTAAQVSRFLTGLPDAISAVLIYGVDDGLVRERAEALTQTLLGTKEDDPFRLAVLTGEMLRQDPARLADEAASMSLMGGRRVVRVREATDSLADKLAAILDGPGPASFLIIEAGDLGKSSKLRGLAEQAPNAAAIACYADGPAELVGVVRDTLGQHRIGIDEEALRYLVQSLGGDRGVTRQELEKLALAVGDSGGKVTLDVAIATIGNSSALEIEDVIYDAFEGAAALVDARLTRLFQQGEAPVTILRAAQRHLHRLHLCAANAAAGTPVDSVVRSLRPPIFFRYEPRFKRQVQSWTVDRLEQTFSALTQAELGCKTTGMPDQTICRHALTTLRPSR